MNNIKKYNKLINNNKNKINNKIILIFHPITDLIETLQWESNRIK